MNTKIAKIKDWSELASRVRWNASEMAKHCGVSMRTLQRYFKKRSGKTPKAWLVEQRQQRAALLLRQGGSVKEVAGRTGYRHASNFSREFKKHWGHNPNMEKNVVESTEYTNVA